MNTATERDVLYMTALAAELRQNPTGAADLRRAALTDAPWQNAPASLWATLAMAPGTPAAEEQAHVLAAALYAWHPVMGQASFPDALRVYARRHMQEVGMLKLRFESLLDRPWEQLPHELMHFVRKLAQDGITLDWPQLLADLRGWDDTRTNEDRTQVRWARQFWG